MYGREVQERKRYTDCSYHSNSLSNKMDNSLLAVRDINHKYIVVEKKIFVETIDCQSVRSGNKWILEYLKYMRPAKIVIDGAGGQKLLADDLKEFHIKGVVLPTVKEIISANTAFEAGLFSESICHMEQPSVSQVISNCEKRAIGSNGGFGYKPQKEGIEIAIMDSIVLAHWACSKSRERRKQKVS